MSAIWLFLKALDPRIWLGIAIAVAVAASYGYVYRLGGNGPRAELVMVQAKFDSFVAQTKALGEQQEAKSRAEDAANKQRQEKANAENLKTRNALTIALDSLRKSTPNPRERPLPSAPASSNRPDLACFDRAEYQREDGVATEKLFAGARSLADECTASTVDLNSAKTWAQSK